jgi:hypothetical protein
VSAKCSSHDEVGYLVRLYDVGGYFISSSQKLRSSSSSSAAAAAACLLLLLLLLSLVLQPDSGFGLLYYKGFINSH